MSLPEEIADAPHPGAVPALPRVLRDRIGYLLARSHHDAHALGTEALEPLGLTGKHFGCLSVIADEGPLSQQRLGAVLAVDRTTIVAVVDDLEAHALVARDRNPVDRRAYALEVTPAGRRWLARAGELLAGAEQRLLAGLDAGERATLARLLQGLIEGAERGGRPG